MSILAAFERLPRRSRFSRRVNYLRKCEGRDPQNIVEGVKSCTEKIQKGVRKFVVYGEPQSGKTEFMMALTCKLLDMSYETIVVLVNDSLELERQNRARFAGCLQTNVAPLLSTELDNLELLDKGRERIIFCRKNGRILRKLIQKTRRMQKFVIIDDEADYATPDNNVNEDADSSAINGLVSRLINDKQGLYIGVTATPGRLDLNDTFNIEAKDWVFIEPPKTYVGRSDFFPMTVVGEGKEAFHLKKIRGSQNSPGELIDAVRRFLIRAAFLNLGNVDNECQTMGCCLLIHTSGRVLEHDRDKIIIEKYLNKLAGGASRDMCEKEYERIRKVIPEALPRTRVDAFKILKIIYDNIGSNSICLINSNEGREVVADNVQKASNPSSMFTIAIGGNMISRGLTFNNLLGYFFTRDVRGKMVQSTYIQRARMFGMRRKYLQHFEMTIPEGLYARWEKCFTEHEVSIRYLKKSKEYLHFYSDRTTPASRVSIYKKKVRQEEGEIDAGSIFFLSSEMEEVLRDESMGALERIQLLYELELIDRKDFREELYEYLRQITRGNDAKVGLVLRANGTIHDMNQYADCNPMSIAREGGQSVIGPTISSRKKIYSRYDHLIMPTRYENRARFLYVGHADAKIMRRKDRP